jgi:hypothetical protein
MTDDTPVPHHGRIFDRRRVLKSGVVAYNNRHLTVPCAVRDISETGARLRVDLPLQVPDTFELLIPLDGLEANCKVVWRRGTDVGIRFTSPPLRSVPTRKQVVNPVTLAAPILRRRPVSIR